MTLRNLIFPADPRAGFLYIKNTCILMLRPQVVTLSVVKIDVKCYFIIFFKKLIFFSSFKSIKIYGFLSLEFHAKCYHMVIDLIEVIELI